MYDVLDRTMAARTADIARYRALGENTAFAGAAVRTIGDRACRANFIRACQTCSTRLRS
jgi:hypothetical protein